MATPLPWSYPTAGSAIPSTTFDSHNIYYAGDYWFSFARPAATPAAYTLRYAADPSATWSTATLPSAPAGVTSASLADSGGMQYDGTHYAFALSMGTASRLYYATDPSGTWTEHQFDTTGKYRPNALLHDGSRWIIAGAYSDTAAYPNPPFVAYTGAGSAVTSTYTFGTSTAATGYDVADLGGSGTRTWSIHGLEFDGTTYVAAAGRQPTSGSNGHLRYCTDITAASWGTPTTTQISPVDDLRYYADAGFWVSMGADPTPWFTDSPTGTWTQIGTATTLMNRELLNFAYGNGAWVAAGGFNAPSSLYPRLTYVEAATPNAATYTAVGTADMDFTSTVAALSKTIMGVDYYAGYFVAGAEYEAEINYCWVGVPATGPSYLRQRQSPVRTPSRVRGVNLRARQTPYVT